MRSTVAHSQYHIIEFHGKENMQSISASSDHRQQQRGAGPPSDCDTVEVSIPYPSLDRTINQLQLKLHIRITNCNIAYDAVILR
jgi:hypothetical protein